MGAKREVAGLKGMWKELLRNEAGWGFNKSREPEHHCSIFQRWNLGPHVHKSSALPLDH